MANLTTEARRRLVWAGLRVFLWAALLVGVVYGLGRLEQEVHAQERFFEPPEIALIDVPPGLEDVMRDDLAPFVELAWVEPELCRMIGLQLEQNAWVRNVKSVRRFGGGTIEVRCRYRRPAAMVQDRAGFVLVDEERVRLPGRYPYAAEAPGWVLIQGVGQAAPEPGQFWNAPDLAGGLGVAERIADEAFAGEIRAVRVHNYGGREDARQAHIELATDRVGGRIIWGSAPGEEIEENSTEQKLAILRRNYELFGRADAGRAVIDISTFPDRFTTPAGEPQGANGV